MRGEGAGGVGRASRWVSEKACVKAVGYWDEGELEEWLEGEEAVR